VPLDKIVVQLNVDMIGRSRQPGTAAGTNSSLTGPNETYVIGSKMMSSTLGALSERVNKDYLDLTFNYKYDEPSDPNRFFFRSDHYNYAKKGIPIIFYFSGVHGDYHRVSDEIGAIDFTKLERVSRTIYATAYTLAELPARPPVDRKLPAQLSTEE
jgi:Zn-dependent M28 family amino/carboxypeptidase